MTTHMVQCPCRGLKGERCPRCRGFGSYEAAGPNPDPLRAEGTDRYHLPPTRVHGPGGSAGVIVWLAAGLGVLLLVGIAALAVLILEAAPRGAPDVPVSPPAQALPGAPLTRAVSPGPSTQAIGPGRQAGGAPQPSAVRGLATWYDAPSMQDAAAGPALRRTLGSGWRGSWVRVSTAAGGEVRWVLVRLTDWCACGDRNGRPTVIDLDDQAFDEIASLGAGVIRVTVERVDGIPLPATETAP